MNETDKKTLNKFKNVSAVSFSTYGKELMICFSGFEDEEDLKDFTDFLFAKIKMSYTTSENVPSFH